MVPVVLLNNSSATGAQTAVDLHGVTRGYTVQCNTGATYSVEGSLDGSSWYQILSNSDTSEVLNARHVRYVRANVTSNPGSTTIVLATDPIL